MVSILTSMPWQISAVIILLCLFSILYLSYNTFTLIKLKRHVKYKDLVISDSNNQMETFLNTFALYQSEYMIIHQHHIECINQINQIEYKTRPNEQFNTLKKYIVIIENILYDSYSDLVKKHYGRTCNLLNSEEYRHFNLLCSSFVHAQKTRIESLIENNHLSDMSTEQSKAWRDSIINSIFYAAKCHFNEYYSATFTKPSLQEFFEIITGVKETKIRTILANALDEIVYIAKKYNDKIKLIETNYNTEYNEFIEKWKNKFESLKRD